MAFVACLPNVVTLIDTVALPPFRSRQTILDFAIALAELRPRAICRLHYIAELLSRNPLDETSSGGGTLTQKLPVLALSYPY
jgi:hypothetical protein